MNQLITWRGAVCVLGLFAAASMASAGDIAATFSAPMFDRWMYPYNSANPQGSETEASVFSVIGSETEWAFDNRDGQMIIGYATGGAIPAGQPVANYRIRSARLIARASRDNAFVYDGTPDSFRTLLPMSDPDFLADEDAGQPIELFMCGYRGGWALTGPTAFGESTPFHNGAPFPFPARGIRNAFAAEFDAGGLLIDNSNNRDQRREVRPLAIGNADLPQGALVPRDTDFVFEIDLTNPQAIRYLRESLAAGQLNVVISSLAITEQQSANVPAFYCKEMPAAVGGVPARLELSVCVGHPADWDCSGVVEVQDIFAYLASWFAGDGDFDASGVTEVPDLFAFLTAWFGA
ncbi:MAG: hypothetical protein KF699_15140 [Phycisphaeraceae bacterium]|nr:hypothetical protein [Phycisphaeraceae bacterium]